MAVFKFNKQLAIGNAAESRFLEKFPALTVFPGREYDFVTPAGLKCELKSDSKTIKTTKNFFIETVSNDKTDAIGGPFQSLSRGGDLFLYQYSCSSLFIFNTSKFCARFLANLDKIGSEKRIANPNYTTLGYAVPREIFADLEQSVEVLNG